MAESTFDDKGQKVVWAAAVTQVDTTAKEVIGSTRYHGVKVYRYLEYTAGSTGVAAADGVIVGYLAADRTKVTADVSTCDATPIPAGMLVSAPAEGQFCWVQVKGPATVSQAIASGSNGCPCKFSTDGALSIQTAVTLNNAAVASNASAKTVILTCPA